MKYVRKVGKNQDYKTITDALQMLPDEIKNGSVELILELEAGTYIEKLKIIIPKVQIIGVDENPDKTIIQFADGAKDLDENGQALGTFRTATVYVEADCLKLKNIHIANTAGPGKVVGQAVALSLNCKEAWISNCIFTGDQDTIFLAPLPPAAIEKNGFLGSENWQVRAQCVNIFQTCRIEGGVDFIFGGGAAWFQDCTIVSNPLEQSYITAASTPQDARYGFVFHSCRLVSEATTGSVYLGRPWRDYAQTAFIECELGGHIHPSGWHDWNKELARETTEYIEFENFGPGAKMEGRVPWMKQFSAGSDFSEKYTFENFLNHYHLEMHV